MNTSSADGSSGPAGCHHRGGSTGGRWLMLLAASAALSIALPSNAAVVDRVVFVFSAPETGGPGEPQMIFERELAFEARLESLATGEPLRDERGAIAERHVRGALDRHIATELLAHIPVERDRSVAAHPCDLPSGSADDSDLERRTKLARAVLSTRVRGDARLQAAAEAEGIGEAEISRMVRREALAARYLDLMVTPMLAPSEAELREGLRQSPFREGRFDEVRCDLRRWVIAQRLGIALTGFLQSSRARVHVRRVRAR